MKLKPVDLAKLMVELKLSGAKLDAVQKLKSLYPTVGRERKDRRRDNARLKLPVGLRCSVCWQVKSHSSKWNKACSLSLGVICKSCATVVIRHGGVGGYDWYQAVKAQRENFASQSGGNYEKFLALPCHPPAGFYESLKPSLAPWWYSESVYWCS